MTTATTMTAAAAAAALATHPMLTQAFLPLKITPTDCSGHVLDRTG
jgi:hypothetical protein